MDYQEKGHDGGDGDDDLLVAGEARYAARLLLAVVLIAKIL